MQEELLPLFPLQIVLLPGSLVPLHIFEDRYKEMIADVLERKSEFGVVQAGEKGILSTGCTASVETVAERYADGRLDILCLGRRRFEISDLNNDRSYLRGRVEFFDDDEFEPVPKELTERMADCLAQLRSIEEEEKTPSAVSSAPLSFRIGRFVDDLNIRQLLLGTRSEAQRLRALSEFIPGYVRRQRHTTHIRTVAPKNGHGKYSAQIETE